MSLWSIFRGNKRDAKTVGEFLTYAIDHVSNYGTYATCETTLENGTRVKLSMERIPPQPDRGTEHG